MQRRLTLVTTGAALAACLGLGAAGFGCSAAGDRRIGPFVLAKPFPSPIPVGDDSGCMQQGFSDPALNKCCGQPPSLDPDCVGPVAFDDFMSGPATNLNNQNNAGNRSNLNADSELDQGGNADGFGTGSDPSVLPVASGGGGAGSGAPAGNGTATGGTAGANGTGAGNPLPAINPLLSGAAAVNRPLPTTVQNPRVAAPLPLVPPTRILNPTAGGTFGGLNPFGANTPGSGSGTPSGSALLAGAGGANPKATGQGDGTAIRAPNVNSFDTGSAPQSGGAGKGTGGGDDGGRLGGNSYALGSFFGGGGGGAGAEGNSDGSGPLLAFGNGGGAVGALGAGGKRSGDDDDYWDEDDEFDGAGEGISRAPGSTDPEDYLHRANAGDTIFKIVTRRYRKKTSRWSAVSDDKVQKTVR